MIEKADVENAARLARLSLSSGEIDRITADLHGIVGYVEQLMSVDVDGVEPMMHPFNLTAVRRDDVVEPPMGPRAVGGSAGFADGLVRVPKVIE